MVYADTGVDFRGDDIQFAEISAAAAIFIFVFGDVVKFRFGGRATVFSGLCFDGGIRATEIFESVV